MLMEGDMMNTMYGVSERESTDDEESIRSPLGGGRKCAARSERVCKSEAS